MTAMLSLQNVLAWAAQVSVLIGIGALLPQLLRIRHPRWHLAYCQALLLACLALPVVQPWRHSDDLGGTTAQHGLAAAAFSSTGAPAAGAVEWPRMLAWIIVAATAARLCWFVAGLWRVRRY